MSTLTAWHEEVRKALDAVLPAQYGPAKDLPHTGTGVAQCVVLWPSAGSVQTRAAGTPHQRTDTVRAVFVGPDALSCLAAVTKGRNALQGARLIASGTGGGALREAGFENADPTPEPGTDPVRVSLSIQFSAITKEPT